jgi:hypothetical protein
MARKLTTHEGAEEILSQFPVKVTQDTDTGFYKYSMTCKKNIGLSLSELYYEFFNAEPYVPTKTAIQKTRREVIEFAKIDGTWPDKFRWKYGEPLPPQLEKHFQRNLKYRINWVMYSINDLPNSYQIIRLYCMYPIAYLTQYEAEYMPREIRAKFSAVFFEKKRIRLDFEHRRFTINLNELIVEIRDEAAKFNVEMKQAMEHYNNALIYHELLSLPGKLSPPDIVRRGEALSQFHGLWGLGK